MTPNSWAWGELDPLLKPSTLCDSEECMRHLSKFLRTLKIATWFKVSRKCQNPKTIRLREPIRANVNNNTTQSKLKENTRDYAKRGKMRLAKSRLVELCNLIGWADEYLFLFNQSRGEGNERRKQHSENCSSVVALTISNSTSLRSAHVR